MLSEFAVLCIIIYVNRLKHDIVCAVLSLKLFIIIYETIIWEADTN